MSDIISTIKKILFSAAKAIGKAVTAVVRSAKYKLNELCALSKRRDLVSELGAKVLDLSKSGLVLPAEAQELIQQISALEVELETMRADHAAQKAAAAEQHAAEKAARAAEKAAVKTSAEIGKGTAPVEIELSEVEAPAAEIEVPAAETPAFPTLDIEAEDKAENPAEQEAPTLNV